MKSLINFGILEDLPIGICIIDKNYKIIYWNDTLATWTKKAIEKVLNVDLRAIFPKINDIHYSSRLNDLFMGGPPVIFSSQIHNHIFSAFTPHNELRIQNVVVSAIPSDIENEFYVMFAVTDVTEITHRNNEYRKLKVEAENRALEISKLNDNLKEVNAQKDKFFSIISHDLKSPFNGFLGLISLLKQNISEFSIEEISEMIDLMDKSANSVWELLETLLEWARSQTGKIPFNPDYQQLSDILQQQIYLFSTVADNKEIHLISEIEDTSIISYFDYKMIETVARNLVSNSLKFTEKGGTIILKIESKENDVIFSVIDNGVGISEANLEKLFRIDTQVTTLGTSNEKGTGLGLILCKDFVEKNGGKIWVESELGKGTKFSFSLPKVEIEN
jgi:signal transduction histidine kinase